MRVFPVRSTIYRLLLVLGPLLLMGCTERAMQIEFLAKNILSSYDFKVTNAVNNTDIAPANGVIPFEVECSRSVIDVQVFDATTQGFKKLVDLDPTASLNCVETQTARFSMTYAQVGAVANPSNSGDQRHEIQVQLSVKNFTGEIQTSQKKFAAFFEAPSVNITSPSNVNASSSAGAAGTTYTVNGSCELRGANVVVWASFADPETVACGASTGTFTADLTVKAALTDGTATLSAKHATSAPYYAYGSTSEDIVIDRTVPAVAITSPAASAFLTSAHVTSGKYTVAGTCESGLSVTLTSTPSYSTTVSCVSGSFTASMNVFQGAVSVMASQTDQAGNTGSSSRSFNIDSEGPAAFTISGIRSSLTDTYSDLIVNNVLGDISPQIHFTSAVGADNGYEVTIRQASGGSSGAVVCSQTASNGATSLNMTNCTLAMLVQGSSYKIYISAADAYSNRTTATNDGYEFTVNYPVPRVTSLTFATISAGTYAPVGTTINIDLSFDRPVEITSGTPTIRLNTVSGGLVVTGVSAGTPPRRLRFAYMVGPGEFATPVDFHTHAILGNVVDVSTRISADLNIPTNLIVVGTNAFNVDTVAPPPLTSVDLTAQRPFYNETPVINYVLPADTNGDALTVRVELQGGSISNTYGAVGNATRLTGFNLDKGTVYTLNAYTVDPAGNISTPYTKTFTSFACPNNFLYVYHPTFAPNPFCIAPVEARGPITAVRFDPSSYSTAPIEASYNEAMQTGSGCKSLSPAANYSLPTHAEWNAVANIIASRGDNWMRGFVGGTVTSNYVYLGVTGAPSGNGEPIVSGDLCYPGTCGSTPDRRVHYLPEIGTGAPQELWDFSGNMYELQKDADMTQYNTLAFSVGNPIAGLLQNTHGASQSCSVLSQTIFPYYCGFGSINFYCSERSSPGGCTGTLSTVAYPYVLRGGSKTSSRAVRQEDNMQVNNAGIFASYRMTDATSVPALQGFRCVYHP